MCMLIAVNTLLCLKLTPGYCFLFLNFRAAVQKRPWTDAENGVIHQYFNQYILRSSQEIGIVYLPGLTILSLLCIAVLARSPFLLQQFGEWLFL